MNKKKHNQAHAREHIIEQPSALRRRLDGVGGLL
jgi:hypothetical protein